jgi:hypothetical protein
MALPNGDELQVENLLVPEELKNSGIPLITGWCVYEDFRTVFVLVA